MSNDLKTFRATIAGGFATSTGGFVVIGDGGASSETLLDVGLWAVTENYQEKPLQRGGTLGAEDCRRVLYAYDFSLDVIIDVRKPASPLLRKMTEVELLLNYGKTSLGDIAGNNNVQDRYLWMPEARLLHVTSVMDAAGKKVIRQKITGRSSRHVFLIPDQGTKDDAATVVGAYNTFLRK
jgi:hypothetical protein